MTNIHLEKPASSASPTTQTAPPVPFLDLKTQYLALKPRIDAAIESTILDSDFILGKRVEAFENNFAQYIGTQHAVGVGSGTSALILALRACGIGPGDKVITAANSFTATAEAIVLAGARPVFADVDPETGLIDPESIVGSIDDEVRAIVPVHLFGQAADMEAIQAIARVANLTIIEDACQAHGATYRGRRVGSFGKAGCFSFYPGKNLGAYGDGGAVVTNSETVAEQIQLLRHHGAASKFEHRIVGTTDRLDALQAAILSCKLPHLDAWNDARRVCAKLYDTLLEGLPVTPMRVEDDREPVYHLYVIRTSRRDALRQFLADRGISTGIHYPVPLHVQPAFADLGYAPGSFPVAERLAGEILSLPVFPELDESSIARVTEAIAEFFRLLSS